MNLSNFCGKAVSILLLILLSVTAAHAGNSVNNGGGRVALQVTWTARGAIKSLKTKALTPQQKLWVQTIETGLTVVRVGSAARVYLNGLEVDARNNSQERTILVSRAGWARMKSATRTTRIGFSLHEFGLAMGLDDRDYSISDELVSLLRDDRARDESYLEGILDIFVTLKHELQGTLGLAQTSSQKGQALDIRSICRLAGSLRGHSTSLHILLVNPLPWFVAKNPEASLQTLSSESKILDGNCRSGEFDLKSLKGSVERASKAVDALSGGLISSF